MLDADVYEITGAARATTDNGEFDIRINGPRGIMSILTSADWLQTTRIMQYIAREIEASPERVLRSTIDNLLAQGN